MKCNRSQIPENQSVAFYFSNVRSEDTYGAVPLLPFKKFKVHISQDYEEKEKHLLDWIQEESNDSRRLEINPVLCLYYYSTIDPRIMEIRTHSPFSDALTILQILEDGFHISAPEEVYGRNITRKDLVNTVQVLRNVLSRDKPRLIHPDHARRTFQYWAKRGGNKAYLYHDPSMWLYPELRKCLEEELERVHFSIKNVECGTGTKRKYTLEYLPE